MVFLFVIQALLLSNLHASSQYVSQEIMNATAICVLLKLEGEASSCRGKAVSQVLY